MKLQRSRFRLILLLLVCAFLTVLFFGSRQSGLLPELPAFPEITETAVPEASGPPYPDSTPGLGPDITHAPGTEPSASPAETTPAPETFDLFGL
jgi:hypothetical protein